jgi:hypothetical protein
MGRLQARRSPHSREAARVSESFERAMDEAGANDDFAHALDE